MKHAREDKKEVDEDQKVKDGGKSLEEEEMDSDSDCLEWDLRNTESVFSELSELSREYVENVDQGASVRGTCMIMCLICMCVCVCVLEVIYIWKKEQAKA